MFRIFVPLLFASTALAQWEAGAILGYGWYRNARISTPESNVGAGVRSRFVAGAILADQPHEYLAGELRYLFHDGDPFFETGGARANIQGQSHTLTYELLIHLIHSEARIRPFVAAGAGAKGYIVSGPAPIAVALAVATLQAHDVWKLVWTLGGGVKFRLHPNLSARIEFRDYITTFPRTLIVPAPGNSARGLFQQLTPSFGLSYVFSPAR
jgi:opacity protein-like surface antigen